VEIGGKRNMLSGMDAPDC